MRKELTWNGALTQDGDCLEAASAWHDQGLPFVYRITNLRSGPRRLHIPAELSGIGEVRVWKHDTIEDAKAHAQRTEDAMNDRTREVHT